MKGECTMKKLNKKSGFTLVECVVAMAILAIMTLMLAMMMNIIVNLRNDNRNTEEDVDRQVEYLVNEQSTVTEEIPDANIDFGGGIVIPGDNANKVYINDPNANAQIGAVDFGIEVDEAITTSSDDSPGDVTTTSEKDIQIDVGDKRVYGAIEVDGGVNVSEKKSEENGGVYTKEWTFEFTATESSDIKALKAVFPAGATLISYTVENGDCNVYYLGNRIVRFSPQSDATQGNKQYIKVTIEFTVPKSKFVYLDGGTTKDDNFSHYFTGSGNGSTVTLVKVVGKDLKHNGEFMALNDDRRDDPKDTND